MLNNRYWKENMVYQKLIQQSLEFIEKNLENSIRTTDVAKESGYSLYHFHRLFLAVVGTTIADYLRRRRLTQAAISLLDTKREIIQIAFDYQFETQESFTRAFKSLFEITPARYRKMQIPKIGQYQLKIDLIHIPKAKGVLEMKPKIIEKDEFKVVGLSKNYVFKQPNDIPELWAEFNRRENEIKNTRSNGIYYGVCIQTDDKSEEFGYVACVEVSDFDAIPAGMKELTIPTQNYAVFTAQGVQNIQPTFEYIYGKWTNESEYELENSPDFEFYDERFNPENPLEGEIDVYIPIKTR